MKNEKESFYIEPLVMQLHEMWRAKSAGVVDARFIGILIISTAFWVVYAFAIRNWVMEVIYPLTLVILMLIFLLRFRYARHSGDSLTI